jgi:hypothetical protein
MFDSMPDNSGLLTIEYPKCNSDVKKDLPNLEALATLHRITAEWIYPENDKPLVFIDFG